MSTKHQLILGAFFLSVVMVLGYYTLFLTDFKLFGNEARMLVYFENTNGLREGDSVLVAGMRWGKVDSLTFDPDAPLDRRITVQVTLDKPILLRENCEIQVEDSTLLGGKSLTIEPGSADRPALPDDTELFGTVSANFLKSLGDVVDKNREALTSTLAGLDSIVSEVRDGDGVLSRLLYDDALSRTVSEATTSFHGTFSNAEAITSRIREGRGSLGRLLVDESLYGEVEGVFKQLESLFVDAKTVVSDAGGVVRDVREGRGVIGRLVYDEPLADDVAAAVSGLNTLVTDVNEGRGTLGRLAKDAMIANNIEKITGDLAAGEGTLGRLLTEDKVYNDLSQITDDLAVASAALRNQQGTIGLLLFDDEIYRELQLAVGTLTGTLEEAREAAPIATFLNAVFLGF